MTQILIGADPEVFVKGADGRHISAYGMVKGDKKNPFKVDKGAVQVDGMALEFNIDPASTCEEFVDNIYSVMGTLQGMIDEEIDPVPVAEFGAEYMAQQPKEATEMGCEPDFDAWSGEANERPDEKKDFRTGAGHIHIGWTTDADINSAEHKRDCIFITKALDLLLYSLAPLWDDDTKRMELYGKMGAYRPKSYGLEYRVLSNAWLKSPVITSFVYKLVTQVIKQALEGTLNNVGGYPNTAYGECFRSRQRYVTTRDYFDNLGITLTEDLFNNYLEVVEVMRNEK